MSAISEIPVYWLNFLLHSLLLSVSGWTVCRIIRDPRRRAFAAVVAVMAIVSLPWFSAMRPLVKGGTRVMEYAPVSSSDISGWTIRIENVSAPARISEKPALGQATGIGWPAVLAALWSTGAVLGVGVVASRQWALARWVSGSRVVTAEEWESVRGDGVGRHQMRVCAGRESPCVAGFFRMRVVVPAFLLEQAADGRLRWALRHEAEHLRSGDSRVAVMLSLAQAVLWWNPFVRSLCAGWAEDRERVCDARATEGGDSRRGYGSFLLDLSTEVPAGMKGAVPMAAGPAARRMKKRLQAILRGDRVKENSIAFRFVSCLLIAAAGLFASFSGIEKAVAAEKREAPPALVEQVPMPVPQPEPKGYAPSDEELATLDLDGLPMMRITDADHGRPPASPEKEEKSFQVRLQAKFLATPEPIPQAGRVVTEAERRTLFADYAARRSVTMMTPPSVTMKIGQKAAVEMIRSPGIPVNGSADTRDAPFLGLSMYALPGMEGNQITMAIDCLVNFQPGEQPLHALGGGFPEAAPKDFDWNTVKSASATMMATLKNGETMVAALSGVEGGRHLTGFFSVDLIDMTGRAVDEQGQVLPDSPPPPLVWREGEVKVRGAIIELPMDGKLPSYWFYMGDDALPGSVGVLYPGHHMKQISEEARNSGGKARWKELGTTIIPAGRGIRPWADFPLEIRVKLSQRADSLVHLKLPDDAGREVERIGYLGHILGCELQRAADGRRRLLLLELSE